MKFQRFTACFIIGIATLFFMGCNEKKPKELPNILWLTSEDNSPLLGCYDDEFATTPNLDQLAADGFLYTHAFANAPVCAPARNTIITGVYACSNGNQHMRSYYPKSETVKTYPEFLREAGYYCTNNAKTDYNTNSIDPDQIWDECSQEAHYKNRQSGQPFFAIFNTGISHESRIHDSIPDEKLRHSPDEVPIPPHHPTTPAMKHDWAQYYDKVEDMDAWVGDKLKELEDMGLADYTIVFYYADHGGVLARSKRYVYETGTHVPFIIRIPDKYKHLFPAEKPGEKVTRIISFVDLAPTLLSIAEMPIPDYMQGNAFLGEQKTEDPQYAYMFRGRMDERYDMCRAVRDHKYRYIKNYMPYRIYGQHLGYLWRAPSIRSWEQAYLEGQCNETQSRFWEPKPAEELYDTENDPWEVNNLANNPEYKDVIQRMRNANKEWMMRIYDTGFIPEADLVDRTGASAIRPPAPKIKDKFESDRIKGTDGMPMYDYMRSGKIDLEPVIEAAEIATSGREGNLEKLKTYLKSDESAIRYWGATGLLILGEKAAPAKQHLQNLCSDESANVVIVAAEALYNLGEKEKARKVLLSVLKNPNEFTRWHALNAIDCINDESPEVIEGVMNMIKNSSEMIGNRYELRGAAEWFIEKWGINPAEYNIDFVSRW
jgi:N-sulfoglucosamine sulfohydrolase